MKGQAAINELSSALTLDERLRQVLGLVRWPTHADIGTDHAHLPLALLATGRCKRVIGIELNAGPYERALAASKQCAALSIRRGDGFGPLLRGEVEGASVCGMGAKTILKMLATAPWLPENLVLQPNADAYRLRQWAYTQGYHLHGEALAAGFWNYPVLALRRGTGPDQAYAPFVQAGTLEVALRYGPHLLTRRDPLLAQELLRQRERLASIRAAGGSPYTAEWESVQAALRYFGD